MSTRDALKGIRASEEISDTSEHLTSVGDTGWAVWRETVLRSAGFPAGMVLGLCDQKLAEAVDTAGADGLITEFANATERLTRSVRRLAGDPRFREAVAWQNPSLVHRCLDKAAAGERRNVRGRNHEAAIVAYSQRYSLKNDTIGFHGPVAWARVDADAPSFRSVPGAALLTRRNTYFETWAVDEFARALAQLPGMFDWLVPRPSNAVVLKGGRLRRPRRPPVDLSLLETTLFERSNGHRTVRQLVAEVFGYPVTGDGGAFGELEVQVHEALTRLHDLGALHLDLEGPVEAWPERTLRRKLEHVGEAPVRDRALALLQELESARDTVACAESAEEVLSATLEMSEVFERVTGIDSVRREGQAYAGRTLVYQDTVRDLNVDVGETVLYAMEPLGALLDSAQWLVHAVAENYRRLFGELHERECARRGAQTLPLTYLVSRAGASLTAVRGELPAPVASAVEDFQSRWHKILHDPSAGRRLTLDTREFAARVRELFPVPESGRVPWSAAAQHSPDVMIAASSADAVARGEFRLVLGELHLAVNTLESRCFVEQHEDPVRLLRAVEADHGGRRIFAWPPKDSPFVSSRVFPPSALLSPDFTYWTWSAGPESTSPPGPVLPAAELLVRDRRGSLVVESPSTGSEHDLLEVLGEILSSAVLNAFQLRAPAPHRPRVTVGDMIVARESWVIPPGDMSWAFAKEESQRYLGARQWRLQHGIPERAFFKTPTETKPAAVDFRSIPLVNQFAKAIRATAEQVPSARVSLSEMVPDLDELWLSDAEGARYTSEFRFVARRADI